mmetsp:Transcript_94346/g.243643  ORF Transcript_94346/g.243643 Transcript_94346/m.243643 type:complete len:232 (-) Transcript_94346:2061-2756(-)
MVLLVSQNSEQRHADNVEEPTLRRSYIAELRTVAKRRDRQPKAHLLIALRVELLQHAGDPLFMEVPRERCVSDVAGLDAQPRQEAAIRLVRYGKCSIFSADAEFGDDLEVLGHVCSKYVLRDLQSQRRSVGLAQSSQHLRLLEQFVAVRAVHIFKHLVVVIQQGEGVLGGATEGIVAGEVIHIVADRGNHEGGALQGRLHFVDAERRRQPTSSVAHLRGVQRTVVRVRAVR